MPMPVGSVSPVMLGKINPSSQTGSICQLLTLITRSADDAPHECYKRRAGKSHTPRGEKKIPSD